MSIVGLSEFICAKSNVFVANPVEVQFNFNTLFFKKSLKSELFKIRIKKVADEDKNIHSFHLIIVEKKMISLSCFTFFSNGI